MEFCCWIRWKFVSDSCSVFCQVLSSCFVTDLTRRVWPSLRVTPLQANPTPVLTCSRLASSQALLVKVHSGSYTVRSTSISCSTRWRLTSRLDMTNSMSASTVRLLDLTSAMHTHSVSTLSLSDSVSITAHQCRTLRHSVSAVSFGVAFCQLLIGVSVS